MRSALDCAQAQELFSDYREGSLNALLREDIEQHLSGCHDCRQLLAALDQVLEVLAAEEDLEPGSDLARRVAEAALASKAGRGFRGLLARRWPLPVPLYALAAGLALLTTGGVFFSGYATAAGAPGRIAAKAASTGAYLAERKDRLVENLRTLKIVIATAFEGRVDRMNDRVDDYRKLLERRQVSDPRKKPVETPQSLSSGNSNSNPTASVRSSEGGEGDLTDAPSLARRTL